MALNKIHLAGEVTRDTKKAGGTVTPGDLIALASTGKWSRHASAGGFTELVLAEENTPFNKGIDDDYALNDQMNVLYAQPGSKHQVRLAEGGDAVVAGDALESNGDGKFRKYSAGTRLMRVEEAADPTDAAVLVKATAL